MSILASGSTDIGRKRTTNQDSICILTEKQFFAVADGMGGHNGGDIASQMSVKIFPEFIEKNQQKLSVPNLLEKSILFINESIYKFGQENVELKGMGTTVSAIMFDGDILNIGNIGDSRVYMVQHNKLYQMTRDHSLVQEKLNIGIYDRIGAKQDPQKNVLVRTVGFEAEVDVDIYTYKTQPGDLFLICSDGLHGKVSDEDIIHIVNKYLPSSINAKQEDLDSLVQELIDQANRNGGQDNISVIIAVSNS